MPKNLAPLEFAQQNLVGDMNFVSPEKLSDVIRERVAYGLRKCYARNIDIAFSVEPLIDRMDSLTVFVADAGRTGIVCELFINDYGTKYIFIWGVYSEIDLDAEAVYTTLRDYAMITGCKYIETGSQRSGWANIMKRYGAEAQKSVIYRKFI